MNKNIANSHMKGLSWDIGTGPQVCLLLFNASCRKLSDLSLKPQLNEENALAFNLLLNLWNDCSTDID